MGPHSMLRCRTAAQRRLARPFSENAWRRNAQPKALHLAPGAGHVDLYDRVMLTS